MRDSNPQPPDSKSDTLSTSRFASSCTSGISSSQATQASPRKMPVPANPSAAAGGAAFPTEDRQPSSPVAPSTTVDLPADHSMEPSHDHGTVSDDGCPPTQVEDSPMTAAESNDDHAPVDSSRPPATHASPTSGSQQRHAPRPANPGPSLDDLIRQPRELRRDGARNPAPRVRVETPKPLAVDVEAIDALYAAARPYKLPEAKYTMVLSTGTSFAKTSPNRILESLLRDPGNDVVKELLAAQELGQLSKMPGGNVRIKVKSREACMRLERQKVTIMGATCQFQEFDVLEEHYYLDISSVDSDIDTSLLTKRLFELGCQPIEEVKTSTEASHFVEKHHTDLVKSKDPTPVSEVAQLMEDDVHTADLATKQDQCTRADAAMKSAEKIVDSCADPDQFVKQAVDNPMTANTAVMTEMATSSTKVTELATLHFANRVFGATSPTKDVTFRVKRSTNMKTRLPKTRAEVVAAIEELYTLELEDLTRLTLALAFFELFLMCTAPLLFHNDRWIQRLTGQPPRKNRLDYVFVSEQFVSDLFAGAKYFAPTHAGDHLAHQVSFRSVRQLQGHEYWRFPAHLLEYPDIVRAIQQEAQTALEQLRAADNPGRVWERWKRAIKRKIQHIQRQLREQDNSDVDTARAALAAAATLVRQT
uniref:Uncharacterized protein n=1 Tax=Lagenidium giganteum TaxID=4803 RepID=A0AAV2YL24_9STRA